MLGKKIPILGFISLIYGVTGWGQNVGIGTTTPKAQFHIQIDPSYTLPALLVDIEGSATPHLVITPDGKVGIGITGPTEKLDVNGNIQFSGALMPAGNAGTAGQVLISQGPGSPPQWQTATFGDDWGNQVAQTQSPIIGDGTTASPITLISGTTSGDILQWDGSSWQLVPIASAVSTAGFDSVCSGAANNYVQKWTGTNLCNSQIYDNGTNIGIGTTTPSAKLDVAGDIQFSGSLMPAGNAGSAGQVLISQGPGLPPTWTSSIPGQVKIYTSWGSGTSNITSITLNLNAGDTVLAMAYGIGANLDWNSFSYYAVQLSISINGPVTPTSSGLHPSVPNLIANNYPAPSAVASVFIISTSGTYTVSVGGSEQTTSALLIVFVF